MINSPYDDSFNFFKGASGFSYSDNDDSSASDGLFVYEPSFNVEINLCSKYRLDAGISYRAVADVELHGFDNADLSGFGASLIFKIGQYK